MTTDISVTAVQAAGTRRLGYRASDAADYLADAAKTWSDLANAIRDGSLYKNMVNLHGVPEDKARRLVQRMTSDLEEAGHSMARASSHLAWVEQATGYLVRDVNEARVRKGRGEIDTLPIGV